jgi:hypothetical protein
MASGDDPLADYQNMLGLQGLTGPNPYLEFTGQIPMAGYAGAPSNAATGQPISSYQSILNQLNAGTPGTTLNSGPAAPAAPTPSPVNSLFYGMNPGGSGPGPAFGGTDPAFTPGAQATNPVPQAAAPSSAANARQAYLQALANPGPPPTYGAQMQPGASQTGAPQPSVLSAFLAAHPQGGSQIPGGYGNTTFFNTLNQLQAAKGGATAS